MREQGMTLDELVNAARSEDWQTVDQGLPEMVDDQQVLSWALGEGIGDEDDNLRDLAVSVLEKSRYKLKAGDEQLLRELLETDRNPYVQFRSAFALFNRGDRSPKVMGKMRAALNDEDVREIAERYLEEDKKTSS